MASFAPKAGCPMCSIVATASHTTPNSPRSPRFPPGSTQAEVLWRDDNLTAYREKANPVSSKGHIIIAFKYVFPPVAYFPQVNQELYIAYMCHHYTLSYVPGILLSTLSQFNIARLRPTYLCFPVSEIWPPVYCPPLHLRSLTLLYFHRT